VEPPNQENSNTNESESEILNKESDESSDETKEESSDEAEESSEESEEESDEEVDEEEIAAQSQEDETPGSPKWNKLRKDPVIGKLLKEHPEIQDRYFKAEKYAEFFPTIEEAELGAQKAELLDQVDELISAGNFDPLINRVHDNNPKALESLARTILPTLQAKNPQLFVQAITPVFKQLFALATNQAAASKNENLKNAAAVMAHFLWNNGPPPDSRTEPKEDPKLKELEQQNEALLTNQFNNFITNTKDVTASSMVKIIEDGLDKDNRLTPFTKNALIEKIILQVNTHIMRDAAAQKHIQSLRQNAIRLGFSEEAKLSLKRAFLGRAKVLIPAIRQRLYAEAIGTQQRKSGKTTIPSSGGSPRPRSNKLSTQEVKQKGMSEMDILTYGLKG